MSYKSYETDQREQIGRQAVNALLAAQIAVGGIGMLGPGLSIGDGRQNIESLSGMV